MNLTEYTREHLSLTNGAYLALLNLLFAFLVLHLWQLTLPEAEWVENITVTIGLVMGGIIVMMILVVGNNQRHPNLLSLFMQSLLMLMLAFILSIYLFYPHAELNAPLIEQFGNPIALYLVVAIFSGYTTFFRLNIARVYSVDQRVFAFMISPFILLPTLGLAFSLLKAFLGIEQLTLEINGYEIIGVMTIVTTLYSFIALTLYRALSFNRNIFIFLTLLSMLAYIGLYFYVIL